jgi:hypothetical protein
VLQACRAKPTASLCPSTKMQTQAVKNKKTQASSQQPTPPPLTPRLLPLPSSFSSSSPFPSPLFLVHVASAVKTMHYRKTINLHITWQSQIDPHIPCMGRYYTHITVQIRHHGLLWGWLISRPWRSWLESVRTMTLAPRKHCSRSRKCRALSFNLCGLDPVFASVYSLGC